jgi:nitrile hydratase accessory protein
LSAREADGGPENRQRFTASPGLPTDADGPVFAEPWQAQAFALAVGLHAAGAFSWPEWAAALSEELKAAEQAGAPDDGTRYYEHWLAALERLAVARGLAGRDALGARKQAWADAFRRTPHGKPVEL